MSLLCHLQLVKHDALNKQFWQINQVCHFQVSVISYGFWRHTTFSSKNTNNSKKTLTSSDSTKTRFQSHYWNLLFIYIVLIYIAACKKKKHAKDTHAFLYNEVNYISNNCENVFVNLFPKNTSFNNGNSIIDVNGIKNTFNRTGPILIRS